ncbi:MAG: glycerophosphodiester phosphodiesterase family protein [Enterocloster sp.]
MIFDMVYNGTSPDWDVLGQTEVTAHRGSSRMAPENTMAAIEAAMEEMADYSEIDVQTTADGIVVVCHDLNLKRVAGVDRRLGTMTYDQLEPAGCGKPFSAGVCRGADSHPGGSAGGMQRPDEAEH